jgi:hypothetical protein
MESHDNIEAGVVTAVVMRRNGSTDALGSELINFSGLTIRSIGAAMDRSDLEIRAGRWLIRRADPVPCFPGLV